MEKSSNKYFKHQTMKDLNNNNNNKNFKEYSWDNYGHDQGDLVGGFLWPPRSYTCSFCKREFKSAQALGGHMNVHRRDRARLRLQSSSSTPPTDNNYSLLNLESNPNPNPSPIPTPNPNPSFVSTSSSPSTKFFPPFVSTVLPPLLSPTSFSSSTTPGVSISREMKNGDLTKMASAKFEKNGKECSEVVKRSEFLRLDLGIGLISESKDDLDLELRLGYI